MFRMAAAPWRRAGWKTQASGGPRGWCGGIAGPGTSRSSDATRTRTGSQRGSSASSGALSFVLEADVMSMTTLS